ncbi:MAG: magnesium transporter MgtE N-terminal domain-containing protein [Wolbachia sp.]
MSEKKYIFKIVPGKELPSYMCAGPMHRIKLVGENTLTKEIILEPYFLSYCKGEDERFDGYFLDHCLIENDKKELIEDHGVIYARQAKMTWDYDNDKPRIELFLSDYSNTTIIPNLSLNFHLSDSQVKELLEEEGDNTIYLDIHINDNDVILMTYKEQSMCTILPTALFVANDHNEMQVGMCNAKISCSDMFRPYKYVTVLKEHESTINSHHPLIYFSDKEGNSVGEEYWDARVEAMLQNSKNLSDVVSCEPLAIENLTDVHIQSIVEYLTDPQLQALAKYLTDDQLQDLIDHLTNHQLKTLAQELNETKLKIIVPILNEDQLGSLVGGLKPDQLKNVLPHLKIDQFKLLINNIDEHQLTELVKDLSEHHLTILSKELWHDRLQFLVNTLEKDKLKDLINKLDHEKLAVIAQDLTDSDRIKVIIDSLITNPEKLQTFAHNMSDQQFAKLLNELNTESLKDIIHKLPYEKVTAVVGNLGNKDQSNAIIEMLKEKFGEQREKCDEQIAKQEEMMKILEKIKDDMPQVAHNPDFAMVDSNNDLILFI